jgi:glycosidase
MIISVIPLSGHKLKSMYNNKKFKILIVLLMYSACFQMFIFYYRTNCRRVCRWRKKESKIWLQNGRQFKKKWREIKNEKFQRNKKIILIKSIFHWTHLKIKCYSTLLDNKCQSIFNFFTSFKGTQIFLGVVRGHWLYFSFREFKGTRT